MTADAADCLIWRVPDATYAPCLLVHVPRASDVYPSKRIFLLCMPYILVLEGLAKFLSAFIEHVQVSFQNPSWQSAGKLQILDL